MGSSSGRNSSVVRITLSPPQASLLPASRVAMIARRVLSLLGRRGVELSILLTDNSGIRRLNRLYKGRNRATDVLAFPQSGPKGRGGEGIRGKRGPALLGDVVLSWEEAKNRAPTYGHTGGEELVLYLIHGILHLLGYRDGTLGERRKMQGKQMRLLEKICSEFSL